MSAYKCRACGQTDTIVEIDLVPRIHDVMPDADGSMTYADNDEAFWEASTTIGYGCTTDDCKNWQGNWGTPATGSRTRVAFDAAPELDAIAEIVDS